MAVHLLTITFALTLAAQVPSLLSADLSGQAAPVKLKLISRSFVPFDLAETNLAFGVGAAEQFAYDERERYGYVGSEQGALNVVDYADAAKPVVAAALGIDFHGRVAKAVKLCANKQLLLVVLTVPGQKTANGTLLGYSAVQRVDPVTPAKLFEVSVGPGPDAILPNPSCSIVAVADEGEGFYEPASRTKKRGSLTDPEGGVTLVDVETHKTTAVSFHTIAGATDAHLISKGVHLPLPLKALEHFDLHSARTKNLVDLSEARRSYSPATQLEPESIAWSADGANVYANLQANAAIVTIDVARATAERITPLGLKDWSVNGDNDGIDTVRDGKCILQHKPGFTTLRSASSISSFKVDDVEYLIVAGEGDSKSYGEVDEGKKLHNLILNPFAFNIGFREFVEPVPKPGELGVIEQAHKNFAFSSRSLRLTLGSSAVDYSNPQSPIFEKAIGFGPRSVLVYRSADLALVWDSGSRLEKEGCATYPWAHNAEQTEKYTTVGSTAYDRASALAKIEIAENNKLRTAVVLDGDGCRNRGDGKIGPCPLQRTVDKRSWKDGPAIEALDVGVICGRMIAVTVVKRSSITFVWDFSVPTTPVLLFTHHLSPASRTKSPPVAYADGSIGDIGVESIALLDAQSSPTGAAAVIFAGAQSGTLSLYEFRLPDGSRCLAPPPPPYPNSLFVSPPSGKSAGACRTRGGSKGTKLEVSLWLTSQAECARRCAENSKCLAYEYKRITARSVRIYTICELHANAVTHTAPVPGVVCKVKVK